MATITMKQMLESGIHFGHQTRRWNPKMARYIHGERHGIYIINLQATLRQLQKAYAVVRDATAKGGTVLFVGTKKQAREAIKEHAERCGMYFVNHRWLGGTLTNWQTIQKSIKKLRDLEEMESSGKIEQFSKKEGVRMRKYRIKLDRNLCGIKDMPGPPAIQFVIDSHREGIAVKEAARLNIPCLAICDTNSDPDAVTIPIPGNDDAIRAIDLFCSIIADAVIEGRGTYEKLQAEEAEKKQAEAKEAMARTEKLDKQKSKGAEPSDASEDAESMASVEDESAGDDATDAEAPASVDA